MFMDALIALIKSLGVRFKIQGFIQIRDYKGAQDMYPNITTNSRLIKCKYMSLRFSYLDRITLTVTIIILNISNRLTIKWLTKATACPCNNKYRV